MALTSVISPPSILDALADAIRLRDRRLGNISILGNVRCFVRSTETGKLLDIVETHNIVPDVGRDLVRDLLGGNGLRPDYLAVGDDDTTPSASDTALGNQVLKKLIQRRIDGTHNMDFQTLIETGEANGTTIKEVGTFQNLTLIGRGVLASPIPKTAAITVTVSHVFTINSG